MAVTFSISPNPHWVVIDNFSKLPVGAAIYTFDSANKSQPKPAFETPNINTPFSNPIVGFANGTFPPIFWKFDDSLTPPDLYYIQVWDKVKSPGNDAVMLWDFDGISGAGGSGGGGTITTNFDIDNLIVNGEFYRHSVDLPVSPATFIGDFETLAPSNHQGFAGFAQNTSNEAPPSPDIIFAKKNTGGAGSDSISFVKFQQGDNFFAPAPTPEIYVNYSCTSAGTEAFKVIQFPLFRGLQNINNIAISISMWNQFVGGSSMVTLQLRQFFGNGTNGPSPDVVTSLGLLQFSGTAWNQTEINAVTVPSISGKTLGNCGNDAMFLQISIPSSIACQFNFILPAVYIGQVSAEVDFHTLDEVSSIVSSPRTGDIRTSINSFSPFGWVPMNDGTIGSATSLATTRPNIDTFPLYDLIWNSVPQSLAPVTGGRGATSVADFGSNKAMALTRALGRVMAGALPSGAAEAFTNVANIMTVASTTPFYTGMAVTVSGGPLPTPLTVGTIYYAIVLSATTMSLASNTANALAGTVIPLTSNASGTVTAFYVETLGSYIGEENHPLTIPELAPHTHAPASGLNFVNQVVAGGTINIAGGTTGIGNGLTGSTGGTAGVVVPHNTIQPTVYLNVFLKL